MNQRTEKEMKEKIPVMPLLLLALFVTIGFMVKLFFGLHAMDADLGDMQHYYYPEGRMLFEHIDPYVNGAGAFPWTYILNVWIVAPFLPLHAAMIWEFLVIVLLLFLFSVFLSKTKYFRDIDVKKTVGLPILFVFAMVPISTTLGYGNIGALTCVFAIWSIFAAIQNKKWLSGILLAFALMKPHATGMIVLAFLASGYVLPAIIGVLITCAAFLVFCAYLPIAPVVALQELLSNSGNGEIGSQSRGIASIGSYFHLGLNEMYFLSAAIGIIYALLLTYYLKKHGVNDLFSISVPYTVALSFWFYECVQDEYILFLPRLVLCILGLKKGRFDVKDAIGFVLLSFGTIATDHAIENCFDLLRIPYAPIAPLMLTLLHGIIAVIGVDLCRRMVKLRETIN